MRLMVWNVKFFGQRKLYDTSGTTAFEKAMSAYRADMRRLHIMNNVRAVNPNVLVILEVSSAHGRLGSPIANPGGEDGSGLQSCLTLLRMLRDTGNPWYLVPPLKLTNRLVTTEAAGVVTEENFTEGIAVYFRPEALTFKGPWIWPETPDNNKATKVAIQPGRDIPAPGPYPDDFARMLPDGNFMAGQYKFLGPTGSEFLFPGEANRRPFLCEFEETTAGAPRIITVAALHTSPKQEPSVATERLLAWMPPARDNEVQVVCGDFNIERDELRWDLANTFPRYRFTSHFGLANITMLRPVRVATYPLGYLGDQTYDNIFTRYGSQVRSPAPLDNYVVNRVQGTVANGQIVYPPNLYSKAATLDEIEPERRNKLFRDQINYGKIAHNTGVSDHMALTIKL